MAQLIPVDPFDLVIFGGSGDLALRKLIPSLFNRDADQQFSPDSRIIPVGRSPISEADYAEQVRAALEQSGIEKVEDHPVWERFIGRIQYFALDAMAGETWSELAQHLDGHEHKIRAVYMATPPNLFGPIAQGFHHNNLISEDTRLVLEKPVGRDYESACDINNQVGRYFNEKQIFRIDHYLGKETVQNLMALRFANSLFEPLWRREAIDHIQITVAEHLGVGNRTEFYDEIGAMRDMVQNHLLQLLCLVAMEPPASLDDDAVRDEKIKVLRALKPIEEDASASTVRGQYHSGAVNNSIVSGYLEELGQASTTETFVALKLEIDNWRWSGVPFYIRTGKRLRAKHSEITIHFKPVPHSIFPDSAYPTNPNRLSIMLQPNEGVQLRVMVKEPGPGGFQLRPVALNLSFAETFGVNYRDAYERLLIEVLRGNQALFMRRDEIETAWLWVDGVLESWKSQAQPVESYTAGSWGPVQAELLMDRDGRSWAQRN